MLPHLIPPHRLPLLQWNHLPHQRRLTVLLLPLRPRMYHLHLPNPASMPHLHHPHPLHLPLLLPPPSSTRISHRVLCRRGVRRLDLLRRHPLGLERWTDLQPTAPVRSRLTVEVSVPEVLAHRRVRQRQHGDRTLCLEARLHGVQVPLLPLPLNPHRRPSPSGRHHPAHSSVLVSATGL